MSLNQQEIINITTTLNSNIKDYTNRINNLLSSANGVLSKLTNISLVEINDLTNKTNAQNNQVDKQISENYNKQNKVQNVKTQYGEAEIIQIKTQNYQLLIIYYIFIILFAGVLFYMRPMTPYWNIAIIITCVIYPFIISYIEWVIYTIFSWIFSFFKNNQYTSNVYLY